MVLLVQFLIIFSSCHGLILDDLKTTQPTTTSESLTNSEFRELMDLIRNESKSRSQLDSLVTQLQNEIRNVNQNLTEYDISLMETNSTNEIRNIQMQNNFQVIENNYGRFKRDLEVMNERQKQLENNETNINMKIKLLQGNFHSISELLTVEFQNITFVANETSQMEKDLTVVRNRLSEVSKTLNETKAEFRTFENKIDETDTDTRNFTSIAERIQENLPQISHTVQQSKNRTDILDSEQNMTNYQLHKTLDTIYGHSALRACIKTYSGTFTGTIPFSDVRMSNGLNKMASNKNDGIFNCEKSGLYFISVFIMTNNHAGSIQIEKNYDVISTGYVSIEAHYTTASAKVLTHLKAGDKISITSDRIHVYGYYQSCLNILQIK